tara:strand:- start:202 stop:540 length:339 start_codon:yes stop_codon:yes gene_type:complete
VGIVNYRGGKAMLFHEVEQYVSRENFADIVNGSSPERHMDADKMAAEILSETKDRERARRNAVSLISQALKPWLVDEFKRMGALVGLCMALRLSLDGEFDLGDMFRDAGLKN